ncbi:MAG: aldolase/citrate lyase family protein [Hyphomicrobium sp.]|nr:aldolase/citrate lyase family protein [Hyphomicrobium sp.]
MRPNPVRKKLAAGGQVLNAWCSIASSHTAEAIAHQGVDSVTVDLQHGAIGYGELFHMLQAISTSPATPIVRVPTNEPGIIAKALDSGAYGIICPMIETADEARALASACRYPPLGTRSFGPNRVVYYAGTDYAAHANDEILVFAQIETRRAIENVDAIAAVPGIDGLYVGPADLSLSFGEAPNMRPSAESVISAIAAALAASRQHGKFAAIHTDGAETSRERYAQGFGLCSLPTDMRFLINAVKAAVAAVRA